MATGCGVARARLPLIQERTRGLDPARIHQLLPQSLRNCRLTLDLAGSSLWIDGPSMSYLGLDPDLERVAGRFGVGASEQEILSFHERTGPFELCFEDSWSAQAIAQRLRGRHIPSLVLVHLDDHDDMAPALLRREGARLVDLARGTEVSPRDPDSLGGAVLSGAIGIGSFVTALYYGFDRVHVRHLGNDLEPARAADVVHSEQPVTLCAGADHVAVRCVGRGDAQARGTYRKHHEAGALLEDLPPGVLMVHIDLDYFVNDYDGGQRRPSRAVFGMETAAERMDAFFRALRAVRRPVEGWLVATSPGFCACRHWEELLGRLADHVARAG